jgi:hypothetical protein
MYGTMNIKFTYKDNPPFLPVNYHYKGFTRLILSKYARRSVKYRRQINNAHLQVLRSLPLLLTPAASAQVDFAILRSKTVLVPKNFAVYPEYSLGRA